MKTLRGGVIGAMAIGVLAAVMSSPAFAELKPINRGMIANLRDVTAIFQSIVTYDFPALIQIAGSMQAREERVAKFVRSPKSKEAYLNLALHAGHIVKYAKEKNKDDVFKHFTLLIEGCHQCHSKSRDKPKR